jgi:lipase
VSHQPKLRHLDIHGLTLACHEWRPQLRGQAPTLWMVHATGFHGRVWDQVIHHLPGHHVIAVDQRGHGRSGGAVFDSWADFGRDQAALLEALDVKDAVGIGHSMGAHALVQAAAFAPGRLRQLVLVDPVIRGPADYHQPLPPPGTLHPSAQRKNRFDSAQQMFERFSDRPPYSVFDTAALQDYCQHGLKPAADGQGFELACAPAFEGRVYPNALANPGVYASIRALQVPVLVIRARPQDPSVKPWDALGTPTYARLADEFRHGRDLQLLDKTHMLPMEDPALTAQIVSQAIADYAAPVQL